LYDPHHRAYEVLGDDRSKEIEAHLARGGEALDARTDLRCLGCHTTLTLTEQPDHSLRTEGVGCEACHGNATGWVGDHAGWAAGPGHAERAKAMTRLSDPRVRAETCAGCHVGGPGRDVTHDLIA